MRNLALRLAIVLLVAGPVGGCSFGEKATIKRCEAGSARRAPQQSMASGINLSAYMGICMRRSGYILDLYKNTCRIDSNSEREPGCYRKEASR